MLDMAAAGLTPTPLGAREPGKKYGAEGCGHPVVLPVSANFRLFDRRPPPAVAAVLVGVSREVAGG